MLRNAPATATSAERMLSPTTWHAEFMPPELTAVEGAQDRLHLAAQVRPDPYAAPFQRPQQRFGQCGAEQHVHAQFRHALCQLFWWQRTEDKFLSFHFLSASAGDQKQTHRRVEHRRNAFLQNGNSNQHTGQ